MTTTDEREQLIQDICFSLAPFLKEAQDVRAMLYVIMNPYEIISRSTELAVTDEDRTKNLLKRFLIAKTVRGSTPKTLEYYKHSLEKMLMEIGKNVDEITADDIRYYLAVRQKRDGVSKVTADNERRILRSFFRYLTGEGLTAKDPTVNVEKIQCRYRKKEAFTDIEVERIRAAAEGEREKAVVELLLSTGCRVSELAAIRMDEMEAEKVLVHGKGEKDRTAYLNARAVVAIEAYLGQRGDKNPYLFPSAKLSVGEKGKQKGQNEPDWWKRPELVSPDRHIGASAIEGMTRKIAKRAGVGKANPHKFRRTCATMALRRGMPIEQVSKMLGHVQIATTQIYLDLLEEELEHMHKKYVV